jgi:serine/threonine protein kinase
MTSDTRARAATDTLIGEVLASRYRIEHRLGEGAMGVVYKAKHVKVGRPFAVKVLHPNLLTDHKMEQRFEREAELVGRLRHPNVIGVVDVGETHEGFHYMVMDYVEGKNLAALLVEAPMPPQRIIRLVRQILEGLYHAHQEGLIHRDFKPENVIVENDTHGDEVPRIVDFGIAIPREDGEDTDAPDRLTTNGLVLGTPHYMAPEQAVADPVDHRIDLFALGIVIYEMLSGKLPFDGSGAEVARANLMLDPPPISKRVPYLEVDPLLEAFARKLLAKSRDMRPPTAKAARELLDLIERDRAAAAAALGVPLEVGMRPPAITAPVNPHPAVSESLPELAKGPLSAPPMPAMVAIPEHPVPASPRDITTDRFSDPLPYLRRGNGLAIIAGAVALAIVAAVVVLIAGGGGGGGSSDDTKQVAATESNPQPAVVPDRKPDPPPPVDVKPPAPPVLINEPPAKPVDTKPVDTKPVDTKPVDTKRVDPKLKTRPPVRVDTKHPKQPEIAAKPPETKPPEVKQPEIKQPVETKPVETKPAEVAAKPAMTPGSVHLLWAKVGSEIIALKNAKGASAADDLLMQYRTIHIDRDAVAPKMEQTAALLAKLRAAAAERMR